MAGGMISPPSSQSQSGPAGGICSVEIYGPSHGQQVLALTWQDVAQQCAAVVGIWRHRKAKIRPGHIKPAARLAPLPPACSVNDRESPYVTLLTGTRRAPPVLCMPSPHP